MEKIHDRLYAKQGPPFCNYFPSPRHSGPDSLEAFALLSFCSSSRCLSAHPWDGIFTDPWMVDYYRPSTSLNDEDVQILLVKWCGKLNQIPKLLPLFLYQQQRKGLQVLFPKSFGT